MHGRSNKKLARAAILLGLVAVLALLVHRDPHAALLWMFKHSLGVAGIIASTAALLIAGGVTAAGAVGSAAIQSHAAGNAAKTESQAAAQIRADAQAAADKASGLVSGAGTNAASLVGGATDAANSTISDATTAGQGILGAGLGGQLDLLSPYLQAGNTSLTQLQSLLGPDGKLANPPAADLGTFKFNAQDYANDPGFKFLQQQTSQAIERGAAARGTLLGGGTDKALSRYQTGLASTYLDSAFNRALQEYGTNRQNVLLNRQYGLQNTELQLQGLQNVAGLGFGATGYGNQDIGNTSQLLNANTQNASRQIAANQIASGTYQGNVGLQSAEYQGNVGLQAAQIGAQATAGAANATAGAQLNSGTAFGNALTTGLQGALLPLAAYGLGGYNPINGLSIGDLTQNIPAGLNLPTGSYMPPPPPVGATPNAPPNLSVLGPAYTGIGQP